MGCCSSSACGLPSIPLSVPALDALIWLVLSGSRGLRLQVGVFFPDCSESVGLLCRFCLSWRGSGANFVVLLP